MCLSLLRKTRRGSTEKWKRQKEEAVRAVREQTLSINNSLFEAATQEDAEAAARLKEQLEATIKAAEAGDIAAAADDHHSREVPDTPVESAEGKSENVKHFLLYARRFALFINRSVFSRDIFNA